MLRSRRLGASNNDGNSLGTNEHSSPAASLGITILSKKSLFAHTSKRGRFQAVVVRNSPNFVCLSAFYAQFPGNIPIVGRIVSNSGLGSWLIVAILKVFVGNYLIVVIFFAILGPLMVAQLAIVQILTLGAVQKLSFGTLAFAQAPLVHTLLIRWTKYAFAIVLAFAAIVHVNRLHFDGNVFVLLLLDGQVRQWLAIEANVHHTTVVIVARYFVATHLYLDNFGAQKYRVSVDVHLFGTIGQAERVVHVEALAVVQHNTSFAAVPVRLDIVPLSVIYPHTLNGNSALSAANIKPKLDHIVHYFQVDILGPVGRSDLKQRLRSVRRVLSSPEHQLNFGIEIIGGIATVTFVHIPVLKIAASSFVDARRLKVERQSFELALSAPVPGLANAFGPPKISITNAIQTIVGRVHDAAVSVGARTMAHAVHVKSLDSMRVNLKIVQFAVYF
ncbi:hypothetical protein BpHYR1_005942 [Brachionus plicatilis]|uniref:Uncharacterized protein n=1 Tax=Brachionus plicatilis TaxID=10195 RepID=A0A3M7SRJ2_BRAPC|nr:hypothetical protein BpHYR1_005942 [Brachionus plicatilis]